MAKDMSKGEKLDLILKELSGLKGELKKLVRQYDAHTTQREAFQSRKSARPPKKAVKKSSRAAKSSNPTLASKEIDPKAQANARAP